jgi:hypothetical protein
MDLKFWMGSGANWMDSGEVVAVAGIYLITQARNYYAFLLMANSMDVSWLTTTWCWRCPV